MSYRYLENVLSRQDNSKTILRCIEDVLCRLGSVFQSCLCIIKKKLASMDCSKVNCKNPKMVYTIKSLKHKSLKYK